MANDLLASVKKTRRIAKILSKQLTKENVIVSNKGKSLFDPLHQADGVLQVVKRTVFKDLRLT